MICNQLTNSRFRSPTLAPSIRGILQTTECRHSFIMETADRCCLSISPQDSNCLIYIQVITSQSVHKNHSFQLPHLNEHDIS